MAEVTVSGYRLHVAERGSGPPLLLVSGLGADRTGWELELEHFGRRFRCLTIEHPGVGGSDPAETLLSVAELAELQAGALAELGIGKCAAAGMSMGGAVVQELALAHPELVEKCVLCSTWAGGLDAKTRLAVQSFSRLVGNCDLDTAALCTLLFIFDRPHFENNPEIVDLYVAARRENPIPREVFEQQAKACLEHDTRSRLSKLACPALVTIGENDILVPPSASMDMARLIPDSRVSIYPEAGHGHVWELPDRWRAEVAAFVAG